MHEELTSAMSTYIRNEVDSLVTPFRVSEKYAYIGEREMASKRAMAVFVLRKAIWILLYSHANGSCSRKIWETTCQDDVEGNPTMIIKKVPEVATAMPTKAPKTEKSVLVNCEMDCEIVSSTVVMSEENRFTMRPSVKKEKATCN